MKKLLLTIAIVLPTIGAPAFAADVIIGTGAASGSTASNNSQTLGGAGSLGNGAAIYGTDIKQSSYSAGIGIGGTIGVLSGAATSTVSKNTTTVLTGGASQGGAGGFAGAATNGASGSAAIAFGGLGARLP